VSTIPDGGRRRRIITRRPASPVVPVQPTSLPGQLPLFADEPNVDDQLLAQFGAEELAELDVASQGEPNDPNNRAEKLEQRIGKTVVQRRRRQSATDAMLSSNAAVAASRDMYPLNAPGMPMPGADLLELAALLQDDTEIERKGKAGKPISVRRPGLVLTELMRELLYASGNVSVPITVRPGTRKHLAVVSGHQWKESKATGPVRSDVMVIGKMLGSDEKHAGFTYAGRTGDLLRDVCDELGVGSDADDWYMTNVMKTEHPEAASGNTTLKNPWVNEWLPILHQELRLVRPKYILCMGADALKALLGKNASVTGMEGRVVEYTFPIARTAGERQINHTALLMACMHPAAVLHAPEQEDTFKNGFARFYQLTRGLRPDREEDDLDHRTIETLDELKALHAEIERDIVKNRLALDAEWHGEHPQNKGSYIRTIQLAWKEKTAVAIRLRFPGGKWRFQGTKQELLYWLRKIFKGKRIVGQFLTSDLEWLHHLGLTELGDQYAVPDTWEETQRQATKLKKPKGGFDTGLALHAIRETGDFGLTAATLRYTTAPRYDVELVKWRDRYCNERGFKKEDMEGYGECPDEILDPYGCYDADVTWRLVDELERLLTCDGFGNNCWEAFWRSMRAQPGAFEMSRTGLLVDRDRMDRQTETYMTARAALTQKLRDWIRWPDMNFNSVFEVREFLFGEELNGKKRDPGTPPVRLRPPGARSLKLTPTFSSDKRPMPWDEVLERNLQDEKSPSTNKIALAILAQENQEVERWHPTKKKFVVYDFSEQITWLRDLRFISQVLKSVLRVPVRDEDTDDFIQTPDGYYVYPGGLPASICDDGVVRTHLYQTKETGRWSSARPPLQNLCLDRQTEFLTRRGWVFADELRPEDEVGQYWPETRVIDFVQPSALVRMPFSGQMVHLIGEQADLLMTPNHRCLFRARKTGEHFEREAQDVPAGAEWRHIHAGKYAGGELSLSSTQVQWLCAVQADGNYVNGADAITFAFSKPRKIRRLRETLQGLGACWTERRTGDVTTFYVTAKGNRELYRWTRERLPDKQWSAWLLDCDRATLDLFAEEFIHWDGLFERGTEFSSSDKPNADWVQIVWALSGIRSRMRLYRPANPRALDHWCVDIPMRHRRRDFTDVRKHRLDRVPFNDEVFCVTVPSSFVVVRRNGKVSVTGNSKKRETDYARILGPAYIQPLRTFMRARPDCVLMEADYTGAELFGMAMLSGDEAMIEHARRNILPENHPDYYDIHSNVAKLAFRLECAPTKGGLESVGKKHMRIVAKSVVFGVAYGRGAKAIALAAKEEGVQVSVAEAQQVIDAIFEMYPNLQPFFESCKRRATEERWMCGVGGRFRRFPLARDRMQKGDMERQGMNFLVQNMVAETMNVAIDNLLEYRKAYDPELFRMILQIHDAILLEVPFRHAVHVYDEVLPLCMSELAPIYPVDLAGMPTGTGPYRLGIGRDVNIFWGQDMFPNDLWEVDLPPRLGGWIETEQGFVHPEKDGKIWVGDRTGGKLVKLPS
jgi:uracil-DNA glycosylase family 4